MKVKNGEKVQKNDCEILRFSSMLWKLIIGIWDDDHLSNFDNFLSMYSHYEGSLANWSGAKLDRAACTLETRP